MWKYRGQDRWEWVDPADIRRLRAIQHQLWLQSLNKTSWKRK